MKVTVEVDDDIVREFLEQERLHIFRQIITDITLETYPYRHQVGNVFDDTELFNSINKLIEYYGGKKVDWEQMYTINEALKKHSVHDD